MLKQVCIFLLFVCFYSYSRTVKGLHVNFAPPSKPGLPLALSIVLGRRFPKLFGFTDMDIQRLFPPMEKLVVESIKELGYMHIQATKPDTVGTDQGHEIVSSRVDRDTFNWSKLLLSVLGR